MKESEHQDGSVFSKLFELPCGVILKNRILKSAMSDSLGDGRGDPTNAQIQLYERWAKGGDAARISTGGWHYSMVHHADD